MKIKDWMILLLLGAVSLVVWYCIPWHSNQPASPSAVAKATAQPSAAGANSTVNVNEDIAKRWVAFKAGGREWKMAFADPTLTEREKALILADLNLIYGHMPEVTIDLLPIPINEHVGANPVALTRRIRFTGADYRTPKSIWGDPFLCLIEGDSADQIFVPRKVSDAYRAAIERSEHYATAYSQLYDFVKSLNELDVRSIRNAKDLFLTADNFTAGDLDALKDETFAQTFGGTFYRNPSILDVVLTAGTDIERYGEIAAIVYPIKEQRFREFFPLVLKEGKWRLLVQRSGT